MKDDELEKIKAKNEELEKELEALEKADQLRRQVNELEKQLPAGIQVINAFKRNIIKNNGII